MNFIFSLVLLLGVTTTSIAEEDKSYQNSNLAPSEMPVLCGHPNYVHKFIIDKGFELENASLGRAGAHPKGEPVMMITTYSKDDQMIGTVDIPTGDSTCIMYHTFDRTELKNRSQ